jgi:hypothetical protein
MPARRTLRDTRSAPVVQVTLAAQIGRMLAGEQADQRAEAINCAIPYPPRMTAAKLPATTARRKVAVMAYSMEALKSKVRPPAPRELAVK